MDNLAFPNIPMLLGSQSPRRSELLKQMGFNFQVKTKDVDESFDPALTPQEAVMAVVLKKINAFSQERKDYLVVCADTMVALGNKILGKPKDLTEAAEFLQLLSGQHHTVITGVGLALGNQQLCFSEQTVVKFRALDKHEIQYYLQRFMPVDKAGAYGIQEWIGHIGIEEIRGSYTNVMGLPTAALYVKIQEFMARFS